MRGHIRKRGNKYSIVVDIGKDENGKRQQKWFSGFKGEKEAEKALPVILNKIHNDTFILPDKITVREYFKDWLETSAKFTLAETTFENYEINIEKHIIPHLGNIKLQKLKPLHINKFLLLLLREGRCDGKGGLGNATVLKIHRILCRVLNYAVKLEIIEKNPSLNVAPPKIDESIADVLTITEAKRFLDVVKGTDMEVPVHLAITLGLRRGEVLGLKWEDINFENKTLTINRVLARVKGKVFIKKPKTKKSRRTLIIPDGLIIILKKHRKKQLKLKTQQGVLYKDNGFICCKATGQFINPNTFSWAFKTFLKRNNLKKIRFHDLRHTFATILMSNNISPKVASCILGHSSIGITMDLYSHVLTDMKREAAKEISNIIFD